MYGIAIKMLLGDRVKYMILLFAFTLSTLLITQQTGVFWGLMRWTTTMLRNTNVPIWVVDPNVVQVTDVNPLRETDLARVKSISGVKWALPFFFADVHAKLYNGSFLLVQLMGADSSTLLGVPPQLLKGKLEDLRNARAVIVDQSGINKLSQNLKKPLDVGDLFDINDHEVKIVGIVKAEKSFYGHPYIYTTFGRAVDIAPKTRRTLSFILVQPNKGVDINLLAERITKETGLHAFTSDTFFWSTIWWFFMNTGLPLAFGSTVVLGFFVGIAIAGQTFYSFVHENLGTLAALKVMGASDQLLKRMILVQAFISGFIGYGLGLGLAAIFGFISVVVLNEEVPFFLSWQIPLIAFMLLLFIIIVSALVGIQKINKLDAAEVFRA